MDGLMHGWMDGWMEGGRNGWTDDGWMDGGREGGKEGWTGGWMVGGGLFCTGMNVGGCWFGVLWFQRVRMDAEAGRLSPGP